jgi:hypothetical protein
LADNIYGALITISQEYQQTKMTQLKGNEAALEKFEVKKNTVFAQRQQHFMQSVKGSVRTMTWKVDAYMKEIKNRTIQETGEINPKLEESLNLAIEQIGKVREAWVSLDFLKTDISVMCGLPVHSKELNRINMERNQIRDTFEKLAITKPNELIVKTRKLKAVLPKILEDI